jgi:adenine/guanine phosphoribosyltransferase-like PRPP-binding protein
MRAVPLGVVPDVETVVAYARLNAELTHRTPEAIAASVAIGLVSNHFFYNRGRVENAFTDCLDIMSRHLEVPEQFSALATMPTLDSRCLQELGWQRDRGFDINAIEMAAAAILLAMHSTTPEEVLRKAVHFGGATHSLASLALGLYAARDSIRSLPPHLFDRLENGPYGHDYIVATGKRLATVCPLQVTVKDGQLRHPFDGIDAPIDTVALQSIMQRLLQQLPYRAGDLLVAVTPRGGDLACAAATSTGLPLGGSMRYLSGAPPQGRVILVDAAITSGATVRQCITKLTRKQWKVLGVVVLLESQRHHAREKLEQQQITLVSHTRHREL